MIASILFFISSLFPIFLCVSILYSDEFCIHLAFSILMVVSIINFIIVILGFKRSKKSSSAVIKNISLKRNIAIDFLFAYILPLIAFDLSDVRQLICFFIIICVYGILYVRNNLLHVNIILYTIGYKAYECIDNNGEKIVVIYKGKWNSLKMATIKKVDLAGNIWLVIQQY